MKKPLALLLVLMLTACASSRGFDHESLRSRIIGPRQATEGDIKKALESRPHLPAPFRLAIYFAAPSASRRYDSTWNWLGEDKDKMLAVGAELRRKGILSDALVISDHIVDGNDTKAIRLAATRAGADAVLIVNGACDIDRYNNVLGYAYILLITTFFIPGTEADGLFMANASLWDVRNQYLYLSAEGEGTARDIKPAIFIDERRVIKSAKSSALSALKNELSQRLASIGAK